MINKRDIFIELLLYKVLYFVFITLLSLIMIVFEIWYGWLWFIIAGIIATLMVFLLRKKIRDFFKLSFIKEWMWVVVGLVALIMGILSVVFWHDNYFGGRDNGVYLSAATFVAENHTVLIEDDISYLGWIQSETLDEKWQPAFHYGYIAWLTPYAYLGKSFVMLSNFILVVFGLLCVYSVCLVLFKNRWAGLLSVLLLACSFAFVWYSRRTMTEMLSIYLVWSGILSFLYAIRIKSKKFNLIALFIFSLFLFVRSEAIFIYVIFLLLNVVMLFVNKDKKERLVDYRFIIILIVGLCLFVGYSYVIQPGYTEVFIDQLDKFVFGENESGVAISNEEKTLDELFYEETSVNSINDNLSGLMLHLASKYNYLLLYIFAGLGILWVFIQRKKASEKMKLLLLIVLFSPFFVYMFRPMIFWDQPWFLRRQLFVMFPLAAILAGMFLVRIFGQKWFGKILIGLFVISFVVVSSPIMLHADFAGISDKVLSVIEEVNVGEDDVVFVDEYAIGRYKLSEPIYFLAGVKSYWITRDSEYFKLNTKKDILNFDFQKYDSVYFMGQLDKAGILKLSPQGVFEEIIRDEVFVSELDRTCRVNELKGMDDVWRQDYAVAKEICVTPRNIEESLAGLYVYKLNDVYKNYLNKKVMFNNGFVVSGDKIVLPPGNIGYLYIVGDANSSGIQVEIKTDDSSKEELETFKYYEEYNDQEIEDVLFGLNNDEIGLGNRFELDVEEMIDDKYKIIINNPGSSEIVIEDVNVTLK